MNLKNLVKIAFLAMLKNKMRSFLTMLGIIIGVGAVIVMVAIGEGTKRQVEEQISGLGVNLLTIFPTAFRQGSVSLGSGSGSRLTLDDVDKLQKESTLLGGISPVIRVNLQSISASGNWNTTVNGVSTDYLQIRQWPLDSGDFFTLSDVKAQAKFCVIGKTVADNLFPNDDPIGQQIRLRNVPFRVIGLLSAKGQGGFGQDQDDIIFAPYTTVLNRLSNNRFIGQIVCSSITGDQMDNAQAEITRILRESHKIPDGSDNDFFVGNQADIISAASQTTDFLTTFLASIAGISLLVGGIGIMNIMLVSVSERTREIGIRMAVGARERDILKQFLVESVVISISGGFIGIVLGILFSLVIRFLVGWVIGLNFFMIILAFGFSVLVGVFFGYYPARKAARLNPIDALRYE
jgi:putative ABC transport system permease protein